MAEETSEATKTIVHQYRCEKCGIGLMRSTGEGFSNAVGNFTRHQCGNGGCGVYENLPRRYPYVTHEDKHGVVL